MRFDVAMVTQVLPALKQYFGYDSLREPQIPVIQSVLESKDTLAIMPTGGGKSLCYQLPALVSEGLTIVVSPLIALMYDQVMTLKKNGVSAAYLNSSLSGEEQGEILTQVGSGELTLLYVSPERLFAGDGTLIDFLSKCTVSLIAVDEAHCVSQWGHDFRPEYSKLGEIRESFKGVPMIALTATADELTRKDIVNILRLRSPNILISSFDRPNITYKVFPKDNGINQLLDVVESWQGESGIVYCLSRKSTEEVARKLMDKGIKAAAFHAGLPGLVKDETFNNFMNNQFQVVVATIAFGMGVDKPDVRFVVHWNMPKSIENYYQETGRAGRDGLKSEAVLLYSASDSVTYRRFIDGGGLDAAHLQGTERMDVFRRLQHDKLDRLIDFCSTGHCRRKLLLGYFDEKLPEPCGNCDCCLDPKPMIDGVVITQKILSAIGRTGGKFGIGYIVDLVRGKADERMERYGHTELPTFGVGSDMSRKELMFYTNQLIALGCIQVNYDGFIKTLSLNSESMKILQGEVSLKLTEYTQPTKKKEKKKRVPKLLEDLSIEQQGLFQRLKERRMEISQEEQVPAFVVFGDKTLIDMVQKLPRSFDEFGDVHGVGVSKQEKYWPLFEGILTSL